MPKYIKAPEKLQETAEPEFESNYYWSEDKMDLNEINKTYAELFTSKGKMSKNLVSAYGLQLTGLLVLASDS